MVAEVFRLAAGKVADGEIATKAEAASWVARRLNVMVGEEWDNALAICADYLESAGDEPEEIAQALSAIAEAIYPNAGVSKVAEPPEETAAESTDTEPEPDVEPEPEQPTAEPSTGNGGANKSCPNGNCYRYPVQYWWGW